MIRKLLLLMCLLSWSAGYAGAAAAAGKTFTVASSNLSVSLDGNGKVTGLRENIGGAGLQEASAGFGLTDGSSGLPLDVSMDKASADKAGNLLFSGRADGGKMIVSYEINGSGQRISFKAVLKNTGREQRRLTVKFRLPVLYGDGMLYWDGYNQFNQTAGLQHNKRIGSGFPMSCVYGEKSGLACGIEGHQFFSWLETGLDMQTERALYWTARMVLDPGQQDSCEFIAYAFKNDYAYLNALDVYYGLYPDLFNPAPGLDDRVAYSNCASGYDAWGFVVNMDKSLQRELLRRTFCGWNWMYAPFKRSGDIYGKDEYWNWGCKDADNNPNFKGSAADYRQRRLGEFRRAARHDIAPMFYFVNWVEEGLSKTAFAGTAIDDPDTPNRIDPWVHTWLASIRTYMWGNRFAEETMSDLKKLTADIPEMTGFSLDCAGGQARHRGLGIDKSPGRAYDDKGVFVTEAVGEALMADYVHTLKSGGRTMGIIANGGAADYMEAFRYDADILERGAVQYLTNMKAAEKEQYLMGRKARCIYQINYYHDKLGEQVDWKNMSREQLRDVYKGLYKSIVLLGFKCNMYYTADLAVGSKSIIDSMPARIALSRAGWEVIPAARTDKSIWLSRYGRDVSAYIFVGNPTTSAKSAEVSTDNAYLGGARYLFTTWEGKATTNAVSGGRTAVKYNLPSKDYVIYKCLLGLSGAGDITATVGEENTGDKDIVRASISGLSSRTEVLARLPERTKADYVKIDGKPVVYSLDGDRLKFEMGPAGRADIKVEIGFKSIDMLVSRQDILDYPVFSDDGRGLCSIVLPAEADEADKTIAWWLDRYFDAYCSEIKGFRPVLPVSTGGRAEAGRNSVIIGGTEILPEVERLDSGTAAALKQCPEGAVAMAGKNVLVIYGRTAGQRLAAAEKLLRIWDGKYVYYGRPGSDKGLGTVQQSAATIEMRKKADIPGKAIDE